MIVNKAKSGILPVCNSRYEGTSDVNGYPVVSCYKYLGLMLNGRLDLKDHLKCINKKVNYIAYRMYALRALDDTRLNVSLFKTFAMPLYRLAYTLYDKLPERQRKKVEAHMRVWLKRFARIPINTADHTFIMIAGDLRAEAVASIARIKENLARRNGDQTGAVDTGGTEATQQRAMKLLPRNLAETLRAIYGSRCREHNMVCVTTTHLRGDHGYHVNVPALLQLYKVKINRGWIRRKLRETKELCMSIRVVNGRRLGRSRANRR